ncbi:uncharacterized protein MICPUCDRAFT_56645 [Micromonas pusilla CCMP1545]|uniref:Predicted protein n=1 Tax=Micromonas pusilla (strain CCMP1545) TaxID=564608 RepID=C1MMT1_MICPC|nr:uncharacterized protein MICPUCDRAFT_56645 [Micromonas pusilla CCMP1545]EEH58629.1 predicted protein [Micromonas pusilla CCMP1545]|eukprot:XP_003056984.1 predicted protein [Micromonas pusilla CCMP1545]
MRVRRAIALLLALLLATAGAVVAEEAAPPRCRGPGVELAVGVGCDVSGFFAEALGLHAALASANRCVRTPTLSACAEKMKRVLTPTELAIARTAGAFQDGRDAADVVVRWHLGEDWECPWNATSVRDARDAGTVAVLRSMTEKTILSATQLACAATASEVWVPSEWHAAAYRVAGVSRESIRVAPEVVDDDVFKPKPPRAEELLGRTANEKKKRKKKKGTSPTTTTFLAVFQWQHRKAPDALLKAYWKAFDASDADVVLKLRAKVPIWANNGFTTADAGVEHLAKTLAGKPRRKLARVEVIEPPRGATELTQARSISRRSRTRLFLYTGPHTTAFARCTPFLEDFARRSSLSARPPVGFNPRPRRLSIPSDAFQLHPDVRRERNDPHQSAMATLFADAAAFVSPSRGEGWCLPCAAAMASDAVLIASDFGGVTAYANASNALPTRCVEDASGACEPDVDGLAWRMRWVRERRAEAAALGRKGGESVRERFSKASVAEVWGREAGKAVDALRVGRSRA